MADGRWQMEMGGWPRWRVEGGGRRADGGWRTERWRLPSPGSVFPARVPCRCRLVLEGSKDGMMETWKSDSC